MKKIYEMPMVELVTFQAEEAITTSALACFGLFPEDLVPSDKQ